ncbi:MAG TPA: hypothetical protein VFZ53_07335, partial [Polyangiaceae bacterium]
MVLALGSACGGQSVRMGTDGDDTGGAASGGSPAGGSIATGGSSMGGHSGTPDPSSCAQSFAAFGPACAETALANHCAKGGCHSRATRAGQLDLTPDDLLVGRILDVPASFAFAGPGGASCLGAGCPTNGAMLINSFSASRSWILRKMEPFLPGTTMVTLDIGCGDAMPTFNVTGTESFTATDKACLTEFFTNVASNGFACDRPSG